jgi:hypothetical protein
MQRNFNLERGWRWVLACLCVVGLLAITTAESSHVHPQESVQATSHCQLCQFAHAPAIAVVASLAAPAAVWVPAPVLPQPVLHARVHSFDLNIRPPPSLLIAA